MPDTKDNILENFDKIESNVGNDTYCREKYLEYRSMFDWEERNTIQEFCDKYKTDVKEGKHKRDKYDIRVIDDFGDKNQDVILDFLAWIDTIHFNKVVRIFCKKKQAVTDYFEERKKRRLLLLGRTTEGAELERCKQQQKYFSDKAKRKKKWFYWLQIFIMFFALLSSVVLLVQTDKQDIWGFKDVDLSKLIAGCCSLLVVFCSGLDKLMQNVQEWTKSRIASENLKREENLYRCDAGVYVGLDPTTKKKTFVNNYEDIISKDVAAFESNKNKLPEDMEKVLVKFGKQQKEDNDNVLKD